MLDNTVPLKGPKFSPSCLKNGDLLLMVADERSRASKLRFPFRNDGYGSMILRVYLDVIFDVRIFETDDL